MPIPLAVAWVAALGAFVALAGAAAAGAIPGDAALAQAVQDLRDRPGADIAMRFAAAAGGIEAVATLAALLVAALLARGHRAAALAVAGVVAMRLLQLAVRDGIGRDDVGALGAGYVTPAGAFPSGHVLGQSLVYGLLCVFAPLLLARRPALAARMFAASVICLGAIERVYTGAHWPSEAAGGALLAALYLIPALHLTSGAHARETPAFSWRRRPAGARTVADREAPHREVPNPQPGAA